MNTEALKMTEISQDALRAAEELLRRMIRTTEMQAAIMRDPLRTGAWAGAENVADAFDRVNDSAKGIQAVLAAIPQEGDAVAVERAQRFIRAAKDLLVLDDRGALVPQGIGGLARALINEAIGLVSCAPSPAAGVDAVLGAGVVVAEKAPLLIWQDDEGKLHRSDGGAVIIVGPSSQAPSPNPDAARKAVLAAYQGALDLLCTALEWIEKRNTQPYMQIGDDPNECGPTVMVPNDTAQRARQALDETAAIRRRPAP